jgi:hypothetical protein
VLYLELGNLTPITRTRRDGTKMNPRGEITVYVGYNWRIDGLDVPISSKPDDRAQAGHFAGLLVGKAIVGASISQGALELELGIEGDIHLRTVTPDGSPDWCVSFSDAGLGHYEIIDGELHSDRGDS